MLKLFLREMRIKQWVKNIIIFIPILFANQFTNIEGWQKLILGFIYLSLTASSLYIINDIVDLEKDQKHPEKKHRPIASGKISVPKAIFCALIFIIVAFVGGWVLNENLLWILLGYAILILLYSYYLKHLPILDMVTIAIGFVLRVLAGSVIINIEASNWMLVTTFFFALFFVSTKRRLELRMLESNASSHRVVLDDYNPTFSNILLSITATLAITSYSVYTLEESVVQKLGTDNLIYTVPFIFIIIMRLIFLAIGDKEVQTSDPTNLIMQDKAIYLSALCWVFLVIMLFLW